MQLENTVRPRKAAEMLGVTKRLVIRWCNEGRFNAKLFDGNWFIELKSLQEFASKPRPSGAAGHKKN